MPEIHAWPGLQAVGKITATRETQTGTSQETRYFLLSEAFSPERFLAIVRAHWGIESAPQAQERKVRDELTDRAQAA